MYLCVIGSVAVSEENKTSEAAELSCYKSMGPVSVLLTYNPTLLLLTNAATAWH